MTQPSASIPKPDLNSWLTQFFADAMALVNCVSHGTVVAFDPTTQLATVSVNYLRVIQNANPNLPNPAPRDQGTNVYVSYPLLLKVPVVILRGGGASITFPIKAGDFCLLFFNDREIDTWFTTGQINSPQKDRTHDLSDAWALVGIGNMKSALQDYDDSKLKIQYQGSYIEIDEDGNINVEGQNITVNGQDITINGVNITIAGSTQVAINP